jgi:hypothetical protein
MKIKSRFVFHFWYENYFKQSNPTILHAFSYNIKGYDDNCIILDINSKLRDRTIYEPDEINQLLYCMQEICQQKLFNKVIISLNRL